MRYIFILFFAFVTSSVFGQEVKLAQQYFSTGEYEKASTLYEKLLSQNETNEYYFNRYTDCLIALQEYEKCESVIKKHIKKYPKEVSLYVTYGNLLEKQNKAEEALKQYDKAIDELPAEEAYINKLANSFMGIPNYDKAIASYEKGAKLLKNNTIFSYMLGELYSRKGDVPKMIESFLNSLAVDQLRISSLESFFQVNFTDIEYSELQAQLYERLQEKDSPVYYVELLTWVFLQRKDYTNALRQAKALDKRLQERGMRVYQIGYQAETQKDYAAAIEAFQYITMEKGPSSELYIEAKKELLKARRLKITDTFNYSEADLREIESDYDSFLKETGKNAQTANIMLEWGVMEGLYINDLNKAINILKELIELAGVNKSLQAQAKLQLGDFYLMTGEIWEATLLYSQVDKDFMEDPLGHEARFRNARLAYYNNDFEWAQAQFDILKSSTSKLIANDALELSAFIMENTGPDSSTTALALYAAADLLVFQNKFKEAFVKLDSILLVYPEHSLTDDVYYLKAKIFRQRKEYDKAIEMYNLVIEKFPEDIRADNSLYEMADMYETQLNNKDKAKELYEKLFTKYSNSVFATDARKKFRLLRGDKVVQ